MVIDISESALKKEALSLPAVLLLLFFDHNINSAQILNNLLKKGLLKRASIQDIVKDGIKFRTTALGQASLHNIISQVDNDKKEFDKKRLSELAKKLKALYPTGKKDGTNTYWTEGQALIVKRLEQFFRRYGDEYTDEQILKATESYVKSFNGDYRFMRVLKYFIFKEIKGADGMIESASDLINRIEHAHESDDNNNWMNQVR